MPNIHEEKIRILQKQLAEYNKQIMIYNDLCDVKPPEIMKKLKELYQKRIEVQTELVILLKDSKEML